jgi:hypothetical protein
VRLLTLPVVAVVGCVDLGPLPTTVLVESTATSNVWTIQGTWEQARTSSSWATELDQGRAVAETTTSGGYLIARTEITFDGARLAGRAIVSAKLRFATELVRADDVGGEAVVLSGNRVVGSLPLTEFVRQQEGVIDLTLTEIPTELAVRTSFDVDARAPMGLNYVRFAPGAVLEVTVR